MVHVVFAVLAALRNTGLFVATMKPYPVGEVVWVHLFDPDGHVLVVAIAENDWVSSSEVLVVIKLDHAVFIGLSGLAFGLAPSLFDLSAKL